MKLSDNFRAGDADLEIHSSNGVAFRVHKANLLASSKTFADMFESTAERAEDGKLPIITLTERASVLEKILPYCYPRPVAPPWEFWGDMKLFEALDKYEIWRGIEKVEAVMFKELQWSLSDNKDEWVTLDLDSSLLCYAFAKHFSLPALIPQAMTMLADNAAEAANLNLPDFILKLEGTELGCLCSRIPKDAMVLSIVKYATAVLHQHSSISQARNTIFHPRCGKGHLAEAWDALRDYGTREGLVRAATDTTLCRDCQIVLQDRKKMLSGEIAKLKADDGGFR
ncbi:hypothetical protein RQP46_003670 [Phenoliferia psychrophenolica]